MPTCHYCIVYAAVTVTVVAEEKKEQEQEPAGIHQIDYSTIVAKQQLLQSMLLE